MSKPFTIHTSRTIMYDELSDVMDTTYSQDDYQKKMAENVFNKKTESSIKKTSNYLTQLYGFNSDDVKFRCLEDYWKRCESGHNLLALLFAVSKDYLLSESVDFVKGVKYKERALIEGFEDNLVKYHYDRFSPKTLRSVAQNIASSWKHAGYIEGKIKNTRVENKPTYQSVSFAFCMAYIDEFRGDYLFDHACVKALDCGKDEVVSLLKEASDRDLLDFNRSGVSLVVSFEKYLNGLSHV
jgi:hypothetical protein